MNVLHNFEKTLLVYEWSHEDEFRRRNIKNASIDLHKVYKSDDKIEKRVNEILSGKLTGEGSSRDGHYSNNCHDDLAPWMRQRPSPVPNRRQLFIR